MTDVNLGRTIASAEDDLVSSLAWLIRIRWCAGLGVLTATWLAVSVLRLQLEDVWLYWTGAGVLAYNALFQIILTRLKNDSHCGAIVTWLAHVQIGVDYVAMAVLIHLTGGLESPAILYFFFHILISAILLPSPVAYLYTALATFLVGGTAGLEYAGLLPHVPVAGFAGADRYGAPTYVVGTLFFFASTAVVVAYLAVTLNRQLRRRAAEIMELSVHLRRAYGRLQLLYEGAQTVGSTLELAQVLDRLTRGAAQAMGIRACAILLLDDPQTKLILAASFGLSATYVEKGDLILEHNPLARQVLEGETVAVDDVASDPRLQYPAEAIAEGIRAMLSVPLIGKQGPLGLIRAYSSASNHFTPDDRALLTAIARYGTIAIENAMAYQAFGKLDQAKSRFVLTVTHELRSPVAVIRSLLRTLLGGYAGKLSTDQSDLATRALRRAEFLQTLIDDLLDLAAGKIELQTGDERMAVPLGETIERVLQRFAVPAQEKQITLEWSQKRSDQEFTLRATLDGVDRIFNNLISNAVKYTPCGGRVTVRMGRANGEWCVSVTDTGIGIPEEALPHVFDEFYRAPNAKILEKEGTGLGLAITRDLVRRYGGQITVQSKVGQGTSFTVRFPIKS